MKIIQTGTTYKIYGEDLVVLDKLPAQTYRVSFSKFSGFFLEKRDNLEIKEEKIYGVHEEKAKKVLKRFGQATKNLGVILSGDKGIGKSLFARLLSNMVVQEGMPVILVDEYIPGIADFLNNIKEEAMIMFDEFDKTFEKQDGVDPQAMMLSLFDGTSTGKKLFVITCNMYERLNDFLINRPGRFHFHFRFEYPTAEEVRIYLTDKLDKQYHGEIAKVTAFSRKIHLNYDCLAAIAMELNEGESFEDSIKDLNIVNTRSRKEKYTIRLFTQEGIVFSEDDANVNLFSSEKQRFWLEDPKGNDIGVVIAGNTATFDPTRNLFVIKPEQVQIEVDPDYLNNSKEADYFKGLHVGSLEISLNYDNPIHYLV